MPTPAYPSGGQKLGNLTPLSETGAIEYSNSWMGMSHLSPIKRHCTLKRRSGEFVGRVALSVGGSDLFSKSLRLRVPAAVVEAFLARLVELPLSVGRYEPTFTHTDDYPELRLRLESAGGRVDFASTSQGRYHVPWQVTVQRKDFTCNSEVVMKALGRLHRHLGERDLRELCRAADRW